MTQVEQGSVYLMRKACILTWVPKGWQSSPWTHCDLGSIVLCSLKGWYQRASPQQIGLSLKSRFPQLGLLPTDYKQEIQWDIQLLGKQSCSLTKIFSPGRKDKRDAEEQSRDCWRTETIHTLMSKMMVSYFTSQMECCHILPLHQLTGSWDTSLQFVACDQDTLSNLSQYILMRE